MQLVEFFSYKYHLSHSVLHNTLSLTPLRPREAAMATTAKIAITFAVISSLLFFATAIRPVSDAPEDAVVENSKEMTSGTVASNEFPDVNGFQHVHLSLRRPVHHRAFLRHEGDPHFGVHLGFSGEGLRHHHHHHGHRFHGRMDVPYEGDMMMASKDTEFKKEDQVAEELRGYGERREAAEEKDKTEWKRPASRRRCHRHHDNFGYEHHRQQGHRFRGEMDLPYEGDMMMASKDAEFKKEDQVVDESRESGERREVAEEEEATEWERPAFLRRYDHHHHHRHHDHFGNELQLAGHGDHQLRHHHFGGHRFHDDWVVEGEDFKNMKKRMKKMEEEDRNSDSDNEDEDEVEHDDEEKEEKEERSGWMNWFRGFWSHGHGHGHRHGLRSHLRRRQHHRLHYPGHRHFRHGRMVAVAPEDEDMMMIRPPRVQKDDGLKKEAVETMELPTVEADDVAGEMVAVPEDEDMMMIKPPRVQEDDGLKNEEAASMEPVVQAVDVAREKAEEAAASTEEAKEETQMKWFQGLLEKL